LKWPRLIVATWTGRISMTSAPEPARARDGCLHALDALEKLRRPSGEHRLDDAALHGIGAKRSKRRTGGVGRRRPQK
jgi:hypothetical protein